VSFETTLLHACDYLIRDFTKHLFSEVSTSNAFTELDELDDITLCDSARFSSEQFVVRIELVHHTEVLLTYSNDDDTCREVRSIHKFLFDVLHVVDNAISQNEQHVVGIRTILLASSGVLIKGLDDV
jgi:hypothetical protein